MSSRKLPILAPVCLSLGACVIDLPADEEGGSTGAPVGSSTTDEPESTTTGADGGSSGDPMIEGCGEQILVASHTGEVTSGVWSAGIHDVGDVYVTGALTVEPCAVLRMAPAASLAVRTGGSLTMEGTAEERILVTSESTTPGSWGAIEFDGDTTAEDNRLVNVDVEFGGGGGGETMVWLDNDSSVEIRDSTFVDSAGAGIRADADSTLRGFEGNTISDNEGPAMHLHPSVVGDLGEGTYTPNGTNGIVVTNGVLTEDAAWTVSDAPYLLSTMSVDGGKDSAVLELTEGTEIRFSPQGYLTIRDNAGLRLTGTAAGPVQIGSASPRPAAGDWEQIRIEVGSLNQSNRFEYAEFRHGGSGGVGMVWVDSDAELAMTNCRVEQSAGPGVTVQRYGVLGTFDDNTLVENIGPALDIAANVVGDLGQGTYSPNGVDAIAVEGGPVSADATWLAHDAPYHLSGSTRIEARAGSAVVTVSAGTQLLLGRGAGISVEDNGGLRLEGTAESRIHVASAQLPPSGGDWDYIVFESSSVEAQNVWSNVDVAHGGGAYAQLWVRSGAGLSLEDVALAESGTGCDIRVDSGAALGFESSVGVQCD